MGALNVGAAGKGGERQRPMARAPPPPAAGGGVASRDIAATVWGIVPVRPTTTAELPELNGELPRSIKRNEENHVVLSREMRNFTPNSHLSVYFG